MTEKRKAPYEAETTQQIRLAGNELEAALAAHRLAHKRFQSSTPPALCEGEPDCVELEPDAPPPRKDDEDTLRFRTHRK